MSTCRHHIGYVTSVQCSQCLSFLDLETSAEELAVIDARFSDAMGFNYMQFLKEVQPPEQPDDVYSTRITGIMSKDKVRDSEEKGAYCNCDMPWSCCSTNQVSIANSIIAIDIITYCL